MRNNYIILIILTILSVPALWGLIRPGFFEPHDTHHLADIYEMWRAIGSGQFPPRMGPDFLFGYGYPLFNFYYLLPFYLGAFFYQLSGSLTVSLKMVFLVSGLVSVYGMYLLLRGFVGKYPAIAGAILFLYTPYRAVQIYVRGAVGEALALAILPWVLFFIVRLFNDPSKKAIGILSITLFLFIISHNYFFALSMPFIYLFTVVLKNKLSIVRRIFLLTISNFLALLMAVYWIGPAILEKKLVRTETPFPLIDHFPFIKQLIIPSWGYGSSVWGPTDEISFQIGMVNILIIVLAVIISTLYWEKIKKLKYFGVFLWSIFGFVISFVFMNSRTYPIWRELPFHDLIQFPWRLLVFTTFFSSLIIAFVIENLPKKKELVFTAFSIIAVIGLTFNYFQGSHYVFHDNSYYLGRFFNNKNYSEDYLLLPIWVPKRLESIPANLFEEGLENTVIANVYYFPGWKVTVNGKDTETTWEEETGRLKFKANIKTDDIKIKWSETNLKKIFDFISFSAIACGVYLVSRRKTGLIAKIK